MSIFYQNMLNGTDISRMLNGAEVGFYCLGLKAIFGVSLL